MCSRRILSGLSLIAVAASVGCQKKVEPIPLADITKNYDRPLPPGQWGLRKIDPSQYPRFGDAWYGAKNPKLRQAVEYSLAYLAKRGSQKYFPSGPITHERAVASLRAFLQMLDESDSPERMDALIRERFDVYISLGCDEEGTVLFTGYYSPIFDGSLTQNERFRYPVYRLPQGFQKDEEGNPLAGPWQTRREIETSAMLAGQELAWVGDRFEAYVMTVQGSGFIRLPDGGLHEIGYAGHNGRDYTAIGKLLIRDGKIERNKLSLDAMIRYFRDHPEDLDTYLYQNERYVFFQNSEGGPYGCLGQRVTPEYSVATDKDIFPRACLTFLDTRIPTESADSMRKFRGFALDQDRGAAIRAPGRCDLYMGIGDAAGRRAGYTYSEGKLYYLFIKEGYAPAGTTSTDAHP